MICQATWQVFLCDQALAIGEHGTRGKRMVGRGSEGSVPCLSPEIRLPGGKGIQCTEVVDGGISRQSQDLVICLQPKGV
jgi:hypothetical protein